MPDDLDPARGLLVAVAVGVVIFWMMWGVM
jgi:hypothetical protein